MKVTKDGIITTGIRMFGNPIIILCDGKCNKAWGINSRPRKENDEFESDEALAWAPADPGTYEGGDGKPTAKLTKFKHNKWCARECERSITIPVDDIAFQLPSFPWLDEERF
jgi:hypothetical protein